MRKKDDTLRGTLLDSARALADTEGIEAVNIRSLAKRAGVATGTVYNYFSDKNETLLALTEEYWKKTLPELETAVTGGSFCEQLGEIFHFLREHILRSAGRLMNSLSSAETAGQARMLSMQTALEASLLRRLEQDEDVREDIWDDTFTREAFVRFIMINLMTLLRAQSPDIVFFLTIVRRILY